MRGGAAARYALFRFFGRVRFSERRAGFRRAAEGWRNRDECRHHLKFKGRGVVTTTANKSFLDIAKLLAQRGIGCVVIVGDHDKIEGIVSERDLMRAIGQAGPKVLKEPVSNFMTKTVVTAREADTTDRLMSEMTTHRFRLPVVELGRLIGLVSIGDLVKMQIEEIEMEAAATRFCRSSRTRARELGRPDGTRSGVADR